MYKLLIMVFSLFIVSGCTGEFDSSVVMHELSEEYEDILHSGMDEPILIEKYTRDKVDYSKYYSGLGKAHAYSIKLYLEPKELYTREELWNIATSIAKEDVLQGMHGSGSLEGVYTQVHIYLGDTGTSISSNVQGVVEVEGGPYERFLVDYYDGDGNAHYYAGYRGQ